MKNNRGVMLALIFVTGIAGGMLGNFIAGTWVSASGDPEYVRAKGFIVVGNNGKELASLAVDAQGTPRLVVGNPEGMPIIYLGHSVSGPFFNMQGKYRKTKVTIAALEKHEESAIYLNGVGSQLVLGDRFATKRLVLQSDVDGTSGLRVTDWKGNTRINVEATENPNIYIWPSGNKAKSKALLSIKAMNKMVKLYVSARGKSALVNGKEMIEMYNQWEANNYK